MSSKIEWCDETFNPWWGCAKVSPGCKHCYAEAQSNRVGKNIWGVGKEREPRSDEYWNKPLKWPKGSRVFCASMSDVFEDLPQLVNMRFRLWELIKATPQLDWMLLTKRPENVLSLSPVNIPSNVLIGASAENQALLDKRVAILQTIPARTFLSIEPLLEKVQIRGRVADWVIVGGESGHGARPFQEDWATSLIGDCQAFNIPIFIKQMGAVWAKEHKAKHIKGGDINEWPEWLQVREFYRD